jgi:hypothetical protein
MYASDYANDMQRQGLTNPVTYGGLDTQHVAAAVVVGAILLLWAIRRGFRPSASLNMNIGG